MGASKPYCARRRCASAVSPARSLSMVPMGSPGISRLAAKARMRTAARTNNNSARRRATYVSKCVLAARLLHLHLRVGEHAEWRQVDVLDGGPLQPDLRAD